MPESEGFLRCSRTKSSPLLFGTAPKLPFPEGNLTPFLQGYTSNTPNETQLGTMEHVNSHCACFCISASLVLRSLCIWVFSCAIPVYRYGILQYTRGARGLQANTAYARPRPDHGSHMVPGKQENLPTHETPGTSPRRKRHAEWMFVPTNGTMAQ